MDMQEKKQITAIEEEEEEDDDGPPPGFQCIITPQPPQADNSVAVDEEEDEDEDEDGPPPGFDSIAPNPPPPLPPPDEAKNSIQENIDDNDDDDDGPPPGWEFITLMKALPESPSKTTDTKTESTEELDEGPPPGWEMVLSHKMQPPSPVSSNIEMGSQQNITRNDDEVLPSVSKCIPTPGNLSPVTPPPEQQLPSLELPSDTGSKEEDKITGDTKPTPGDQPGPPPKQAPAHTEARTPKPAVKQSSSERGQVVCGTCQKLCSYPRGAKLVQCPGCNEVNFVLEASEVGQVKCGGCSVLLMYPHGAPAVQCSSCRFVTEIGTHNRRPPLSVQQNQVRAQARRGRRSNRAR